MSVRIWWNSGFWLLLALLLVACVSTATPALVHVTLQADGATRVLTTQALTVQDLLREQAITLGELDVVRPPETTRLQDGMTVTVTRVIQQMEVITETVPFERRTLRDATLPAGDVRLVQAGQAGVRERVYRLTFTDGALTERTLVQETLISAPVDEIQVLGTRSVAARIPITGTIAFVSRQDAWVMRGNSQQVRQVTALGDVDGRVFRLSPDGTRLLFTRAVLNNRQKMNELWLIDITRMEATPLSLNITNVLWADWDATGQRIAWSTAEVVDAAPGWRGQNDLWMGEISAQGTLRASRRLYRAEAGGGLGWWGTRYLWSPTGELLAYSRPDEVGYVTMKNGQRVTLMRFAPYRTYSSWAWNPGLDWAAGGKLLLTVYHNPAAGGDPEESPWFDVVALDITGAYSATLVSNSGMWAAPQVAPDGTRLAYGQARFPQESHISAYTLCLADVDGSELTCPYPPEDEAGLELPVWRWSPDRQGVLVIYQGQLVLWDAAQQRALSLTDGFAVTALDWR